MATVLGALPDFLYESPAGTVRVRGSRLLFEGVIYLHRAGEKPERMKEAYLNLTDELAVQIVDYYEQNREIVDEYVAECERSFEESRRDHEAWQISQGIEPLKSRLTRAKLEAHRREKGSTSEVVQEVAT